MKAYASVKRLKNPLSYINLQNEQNMASEKKRKEHLEEIRKVRRQRMEMENKNKDLRNKIELLEKEDKKIIDKIFFIKNLQTKVQKARETVERSKKKKEELRLKRQQCVEEQKKRNLAFKKANMDSRIRIKQKMNEEKRQMYREGCKLKEKALKARSKTYLSLRKKAEQTKINKGIGKLWLKFQVDKKSQMFVKRLEQEKQDEMDKLKKEEQLYRKNKFKEKSIMSNFQKDQEYQEKVLDDFKNTINNDSN